MTENQTTLRAFVKCFFFFFFIIRYKGQLNSEWIYEVIISPKMQTKKYKDFWPTKQTRIVHLFIFGDFLVSVGIWFFLATILFVW